MDNNKKVETGASKYLKDALVHSEKYEAARDYLEGNLTDGESYTFEEVDALLKKGGFSL